MNKDAEKSGNVDVAFSITPFSHLESADFAAIRASGLLPTDTTASLRLNRLNPVALAAPVDPALASAATLAAPADANATAAEPSIGNRKLLQVGTTCASNAGQVAYPYSTTIAATAVDWQAAGYVTPVRNQAQVRAAAAALLFSVLACCHSLPAIGIRANGWAGVRPGLAAIRHKDPKQYADVLLHHIQPSLQSKLTLKC